MWINGVAGEAQREQKHDDDDKVKGMRKNGVRFQATWDGLEELTLT